MNKRIGILNKGSNNTFVGNIFHNLDVGIKDEGKNTKAIANKFDENDNMRWYEKWWVKYLAFPIIVVIVGALLVFKLGINGEKREDAKQAASTQVPASTTQVKSITPQGIMDAINSLPPLQQDAATENYKGIKVSWLVYLGAGSTSVSNKNLYTITLRDKGSNIFIVCDIDLNNYPQLKIIKRDQMFTVEGEIKNVDPLWINLINCKLSF